VECASNRILKIGQYCKTLDRSPQLISLSVQIGLTPGLYPGPGLYAGPSLYWNMSKSFMLYSIWQLLH